jgi:hypothetical protein
LTPSSCIRAASLTHVVRRVAELARAEAHRARVEGGHPRGAARRARARSSKPPRAPRRWKPGSGSDTAAVIRSMVWRRDVEVGRSGGRPRRGSAGGPPRRRPGGPGAPPRRCRAAGWAGTGLSARVAIGPVGADGENDAHRVSIAVAGHGGPRRRGPGSPRLGRRSARGSPGPADGAGAQRELTGSFSACE